MFKKEVQSMEFREKFSNVVDKTKVAFAAGALVLTGCLAPAEACEERPEAAESFSMDSPMKENWMVCGTEDHDYTEEVSE
jgi:hypothetical protein